MSQNQANDNKIKKFNTCSMCGADMIKHNCSCKVCDISMECSDDNCPNFLHVASLQG